MQRELNVGGRGAIAARKLSVSMKGSRHSHEISMTSKVVISFDFSGVYQYSMLFSTPLCISLQRLCSGVQWELLDVNYQR